MLFEDENGCPHFGEFLYSVLKSNMKKAVALIGFVFLLLLDGIIYRDIIEIKKTIEDSKDSIPANLIRQIDQNSVAPANLLTYLNPILFGSTVGEPSKSGVKESTVDVRDFGAKGDGVTDDTAAIQAAVNSLAHTGGTVLMQGDFVSGNINFPTIAGWITIKVYGNWRLTETLVIPPLVKLSGQGGANAYVQFSRHPQARLISPPGDTPTIKLTGMDPKIVENILISGSAGKAILLQNGALATLDNISVQSADVSTAYPLVIDAFFWVWIRNSIFASPKNAQESIYILQPRLVFRWACSLELLKYEILLLLVGGLK